MRRMFAQSLTSQSSPRSLVHPFEPLQQEQLGLALPLSKTPHVSDDGGRTILGQTLQFFLDLTGSRCMLVNSLRLRTKVGVSGRQNGRWCCSSSFSLSAGLSIRSMMSHPCTPLEHSSILCETISTGSTLFRSRLSKSVRIRGLPNDMRSLHSTTSYRASSQSA